MLALCRSRLTLYCPKGPEVQHKSLLHIILVRYIGLETGRFAPGSTLPVITGSVKLFSFLFQMGVSKVLKIV